MQDLKKRLQTAKKRSERILSATGRADAQAFMQKPPYRAGIGSYPSGQLRERGEGGREREREK